ncbi:MAG: PQQ-dependent sugar dehydrogenase, partial [Gemmatimonadales bacterium]
MRLLAAVAATWLAAACGDGNPATPSQPLLLKATPIDSGMDFTIQVAAPPGDTSRLFIVERGGRISITGRVLLRKHGVRQLTPFLDLSAYTGLGHEYGIYSIAFHPNYQLNRRFFVYYLNNNADTRVVEYRAMPDFDYADPAVVDTLLAEPMPSYAVHYGGDMAFGPDGYLYIGIGDGQTGGYSASSPAQDSTQIKGKFLRLDVDQGSPYTIPPDNPFVGRPGWRGEIWMLGARNPWRWSFDPADGRMYIGEVGEDSVEEIDALSPAQQRGANLGWPIQEGTHCFGLSPGGCITTSLTQPVLEFPHTEGCAVVGGMVYRGSAIPELRGTYFYGDFCGGWVRSFRLVGGV